MTKPYDIPKALVWEAYLSVKAKGGSAGIDQESIVQFEGNLSNNLYKLWNRMCSGCYFPPPVKGVPIPKKSGGVRMLGVPTVADRVAQTVAQTVVKQLLEPVIDPVFHPNSYGYRPGRSAHDAIAMVRRRSWEYDWVVEFDIKGLFDNIDHELLLRALRKRCQTPWVLLYVERWLKAPMQMPDGELMERTRGTPQGGVVSPLLANLFLHYAFDSWVGRHLSGVRFCRYADDGVMHCRSLAQAKFALEKVGERFRQCGLELHPDKTRIVYCKDINRQGDFQCVQFTFLGYTFRPRKAVDKYGRVYPMARGFVYLTVVIDVASRRALAWKVAITLEACHATEILEQAFARFGVPEIINTDQGSQFTANTFTEAVLSRSCKLSMDGRGAWRDNVFVERLWRTVKYEEVYLKAYESVSHAKESIEKHLNWYNESRPHSSLGKQTPNEAYTALLPAVKLAA